MSSKVEIQLAITESGMEHFKNASMSTEDLKKSTVGLNTVMVNMAATLNVAKAAYAAVSGVVKSAVLDSLNMADALDKQAKQANVSTTVLQEYGYAAKQSGASQEAMTAGLTRLTENAYKAFNGNKKLSEGFDTLGVSVRDAKGNFKDSNIIVEETIKKLADLKDPAQQSALAVDLLGKGGRDLVPMLRGGSEEIDNMRKAAGDLGQVLSGSAIKNLDKMGDNLDMLSNRLRVSIAEGVNQAMPALEMLAGELTKIIGLASETATAWGWMLGGEKKFKEEMAKQDAITRELQDMIALKKEYESIIGAQEAFKAHQSGLFDEETLVSYQAALKNLNADLKEFNKKSAGVDPPPIITGGGSDSKADKKSDDKLMSLERQAALMHKKESEEDAKAAWEKKQKLFKDEKTAQEKREKERVALSKVTYRTIIDAQSAAYDQMKNKEREEYQYNKELKAQQQQMYIANGREQLDVLTGVLKEAGAKNKAAAVAYKTIMIATTVIDTYSGAQKAFNSLASIPYVGYALGLVAAGATVAAGLLRVNEIRKQQFVSGGTSSGGMALVGEMGPELVNMPRGTQVYNHHQTTQMISNANKSSTVLNVTINGGQGTASQQLVREIRGGKSDYLIKQIAKAMGVS